MTYETADRCYATAGGELVTEASYSYKKMDDRMGIVIYWPELYQGRTGVVLYAMLDFEAAKPAGWQPTKPRAHALAAPPRAKCGCESSQLFHEIFNRAALACFTFGQPTPHRCPKSFEVIFAQALKAIFRANSVQDSTHRVELFVGELIDQRVNVRPSSH